MTYLCCCICCKKEFSHKGIDTHYLYTHTDRQPRKYVKTPNPTLQQIEKINRINIYNLNPKLCVNCRTPIPYGKTNKYCSRRCSAIISNQERINKGWVLSSASKALISASLSNTYKSKTFEFTKIIQCKNCLKWIPKKNSNTCSPECKFKLKQHYGTKAGKSSNRSRIKRSKDEIKLYQLCIEQLPIECLNNAVVTDGWDADIYIPSINLAIMWNGPWHYKEMNLSNHKLEQVVKRDKLKIQLFKNAGITTLVFEDRYYTPETALIEIKKYIEVISL